MPSLLRQLHDNGHSLVATLTVSLLHYMGLTSWLCIPQLSGLYLQWMVVIIRQNISFVPLIPLA